MTASGSTYVYGPKSPISVKGSTDAPGPEQCRCHQSPYSESNRAASSGSDFTRLFLPIGSFFRSINSFGS